MATRPVAGVPVPLDLKNPGVVVRIIPTGPGATLDVAGLPPEFECRAGTAPTIQEIRIKRNDAKPTDPYDAKFELKPDGEVTVSGVRLERYPKLATAVLRVNPGSGRPAVNFQLFYPIVLSCGWGSADVTKKDEFRYSFDLKPNDVKDELPFKELQTAIESAPLVPGAAAAARVKFGEKEYDLLPVADRSGELGYQQGAAGADLKIRLTVEKGNVVVVATGALPKSEKPPECRVLALDIGRKVVVMGGPVVWQEVFRIR